jgi:hypothetical protein
MDGADSTVLVSLETEGNQRYIFATNRQRENVGASELVHRLGPIVAEVVRDAGGPNLLKGREIHREELLADHPLSAWPFEIITAGSGQALVLARDQEMGRRLVRGVSRAFLERAPGLTVRGAVVPLGDRSIACRIEEAGRARALMAACSPAPELRFQRLPFVDDCRYSGYPAYVNDVRAEGGRGARVSRVSLAKADGDVVNLALDRSRRLLGTAGGLVPRNVDELDRRTRRPNEAAWLGVVHADGNGLGTIFLEFERLSRTVGDRAAYIKALRRFSVGLDLFSEAAVEAAAVEMMERQGASSGILPLLPLILGGDDLTVMLDGRQALRFAATYLRQMESGPQPHGDWRDSVIAETRTILAAAPGVLGEDRYLGRFTACAGIAIVKPHYPFHVTYELAEQLLDSAKERKPSSTLDFHVLYDTTNVELSELRRRAAAQAPPGAKLTRRPYSLEEFERFSDRLQLIRDRQSPKAIPRTALAELREAAVRGPITAARRYALIRPRVEGTHLSELYPDGRFDGGAGLLDLLEGAEVWRDA